jgi:outer membrane protein insertion porin family
MKISQLLLFVFFCTSIVAQVIVEDVVLEGNQLINDDEIQTVLSLKPGSEYSEQQLGEDAQRISRLYQNRGLYFTKVLQPRIEFLPAQKLKIIFSIQENADVHIEDIDFIGNSYITTNKLAEKIKFVSQLQQLPQFIKQIIHYYNDQSFLFARATLQKIVKRDKKLKVVIKIDEGRPSKIENFKFQGNRVTSENTLIRLSGLQNYKLLTPELMRLAKDNIEQEEYIKTAAVVPLNSENLLIQIEEDKMTRLAFLLGFDNSAEQDNQLTGFVDLQFLNLYGTGRSLSLNWQSLVANRSSVELSYHDTGLDEFPINADLTLYREEVDSTYIDTSVETELYYTDLKSRYGVVIGWRGVYPGSRRPKVYEKMDYTKLGFLWEYQNLDNRKNPTHGNQLAMRYFYIINDDDTQDNSHQAVELDGARYFLIKNRMVTALQTQIKVVENKGISELDYYEIGGYNSLRGFREKEFYGYRTVVSSLEIRYLLSRSSRTYLFAEHAYVENEVYKYGELFGFGVGLQLQTRLGLFHLDYALSYKNNKFSAPMQGLLHFGVESRF